MVAIKKLPDVIGFYQPGDRRDDYTGQVTDRFTGEVSTPPSMTKQEFLAECDINNILKEFLPPARFNQIAGLAAEGVFSDLPQSMDFQEAMHLQMQADHVFSLLPARTRERFANSPAEFLAFFENPANREEAKALGLLQEPPTPPPPLEVVIKGQNSPPDAVAAPPGPKG